MRQSNPYRRGQAQAVVPRVRSNGGDAPVYRQGSAISASGGISGLSDGVKSDAGIAPLPYLTGGHSREGMRAAMEGRVRLHACVRAALMSASALVLLSSCRSTVSPSPTPPPVPTSPPQLTPTYRPAPSPATAAVPHPTVIALLADYRLVALHPDAGGTPQEILPALPTANLPPIDFAAGHYLAQSSDGSLLIAPRPAPPSQPNQIALIKATSLQLERMVLLPASAGSIRSVVVGAVTGRIYVFGDREQDATLTVLDAGTGTVLNLWTLRGGDGRDWLVYQGAVSADEQRVFASYHGTYTTGID